MPRQQNKPVTGSECIKFWVEIAIRFALLVAFIKLEAVGAFERKIHKDEFWLYSNPRTDSYVPSSVLWPTVFTVPLFVFLMNFVATHNKSEFIQATLSVTLALGLNGLLTDVLKLSVGRPRPDFIERCFPDGNIGLDMVCTGDEKIINDGRKSFPSGHSSFSFTSMCFITWYLFGKLHVFNERGRGQSWRLLISIAPLFIAIGIAVSRTCDYHHHWQDVSFGSVMGIIISYICYRQYYPSFGSKLSHRSYAEIRQRSIAELAKSSIDSSPTNENEGNSFLNDEKETKWI